MPSRTPADPPTGALTRRLTAAVAALALGACTAVVIGCGGQADPVRHTTTQRTATTGPSDTTTTTTGASTATVPAVTTAVPPAPAVTTGKTPTSTAAPNDGGAEPTTPTTPATTSTGTNPPQDPNCRPGTGPGFPDRPQCEPVTGPDAQNEG